jgi:transcriptional regulator with XRE-family HTH domain
MTIGPTIRQLRESRGWTLLALAERSGVAMKTVFRIEHGEMKRTSLETLCAIASGLGMRASEVLGMVEEAG